MHLPPPSLIQADRERRLIYAQQLCRAARARTRWRRPHPWDLVTRWRRWRWHGLREQQVRILRELYTGGGVYAHDLLNVEIELCAHRDRGQGNPALQAFAIPVSLQDSGLVRVCGSLRRGELVTISLTDLGRTVARRAIAVRGLFAAARATREQRRDAAWLLADHDNSL